MRKESNILLAYNVTLDPMQDNHFIAHSWSTHRHKHIHTNTHTHTHTSNRLFTRTHTHTHNTHTHLKIGYITGKNYTSKSHKIKSI